MRAFSPATPPARRPTSVVAFNPASISGLRSRLLDANTFTSPIDSKYYLKDSSTENTHLPRQGRAWLFDGVNDYGITSATNITYPNMSFGGMVYWQNTVTGGGIVSKGVNQEWGLFLEGGSIKMRIGASTTVSYSIKDVLAIGWHHFFGTVNGTTGTIYIDGVQVATGTVDTVPANQGYSVQVGKFGSVYPIGSSLRDIRIYSSAKDSTAVAAISNQSRTGSGTFDTTGLLAAYPCNEESGTTGYDISGNGNHLTLTNITQATFHASDTGVTANPNNAEGYRLGVNLTKYSEDLTNSVWSFANIGSVTVANQTTAPDGAVSADLVREDTSTGSHRLWRYENPVLTTGVRYTFSIYLKASGRTKIEFAGDSIFTVDLVAETNTNGTITSIGNGWYRVSSTFVATGTVSSHYCLLNNGSTNSYTGDGSSGMYIWGGQVEVGSIATTYQPTQSTGIAGRYIPKRLSSSLAADGNALTVTGRAAYHGCAETPCVTGDGTNVYANLGSALIPATADFNLSFFFNTGSSTSLQYFIAQYVQPTTSELFGVYRTGNDVFLYALGGATTAIAIANDTWYQAILSRVGNDFSITIGSATRTRNVAGSVANSNTWLLGRNDNAQFSPGCVVGLQITTGGVTTHFPLQDGPGSSNTNRDIAWVKSDGTGGVISNAIVNGTVSTIWGNRVPGNVEDWCIKYGGRLAANGAFIAGMLTGGNAADGSAKTLAAGKFGNPFSRLNLNPATAAELNGRSVPTAAAAGADINATITPTDSAFRRTASDGDDRILIYDATLSGADLSNVEGYVA